MRACCATTPQAWLRELAHRLGNGLGMVLFIDQLEERHASRRPEAELVSEAPGRS